jgi:hypothetical protein
MMTMSKTRALFALCRTVVISIVLVAGVGPIAAQSADGAAALRARHAALRDQLAHNEFKQPLYLESIESSNDVKGHVYAVVDHSFATVSGALAKVDRWCDILILPVNVKQCRSSQGVPVSKLSVSIGRKIDTSVENAHQLDLAYRLAAKTADYLQIQLSADSGPLGTRDYRMMLEAVPIDQRRSFIHMSYAYGYNTAARMAMKVYLSTVGSAKVGFSVVDRRPDGQPVYVGSMRGVMERNTMRYYLAIDAYLGTLSAPSHEQVERRLRNWYAATERYPLQLREVELAEYLDSKRRDVRRTQAEIASPRPG